MEISRLGVSLDDDYPSIHWSKYAAMGDLWDKVDVRLRAGRPADDLLRRITFTLRFTRRYPRIDCVRMGGPFGVSLKAKEVFASLRVRGMRFLEYRINREPFFLFYTERCVKCLDRKRSKIEYSDSPPKRVKRIKEFAFDAKRLKPCDVFTIPELSKEMFYCWRETFITDEAREAIENAGLVGFRFEKVAEED